jgi:hypothetical protein
MYAIAFQSAANAQLFADARVNVVVLPYEVGNGHQFNDAGDALSMLVQMNTLRSILKFQSVGAIKLVAGPGDPNAKPETVWRRLLPQVRESNGLLLVWGRLFEENATLYEQTFARFVSGKNAPAVDLKFRENMFHGELSASAVAFPPRMITREELARIAQLSERYARLRPEPDESLEGTAVLEGLEKCFGCANQERASGFVITEVRGDWAKLVSQHGENGWLKLDTGFGEGSLADKMPELHFFEGTSGALVVRALAAAHKDVSLKMLADADAALREYVTRTRKASPDTAAVVAEELRAMLAAGSGNDVSALSEATSIAPGDAHAHNLLAMAKLATWQAKKTRELPSDVASHFVTAAILDPDHPQPLVNLKSFYELVLRAENQVTPSVLIEEAKSRLPEIDKILAAHNAGHGD